MFQGTAGRIAGIGLALGASLLVAKYWRPVLKTAVKGYLTAVDKVKETTAEAGESMQDMYAEAKAEHEKSRQEAHMTSKGVEQAPPEVQSQTQ